MFKKGNTYGNRFEKGNEYCFKKGDIPSNKQEIEWEIDENGCWICTSHSTDSGGYPMCSRGRINRIIYEKYNGKIPKRLHMCHKCDVPKCINPDHIFLGTNIDNINDKIKKGRQSRGEKHGINLRGEKNGFNILTECEAREVKYNCINMTYKEIANKYNISPSAVGAIRRNINWKHI